MPSADLTLDKVDLSLAPLLIDVANLTKEFNTDDSVVLAPGQENTNSPRHQLTAFEALDADLKADLPVRHSELHPPTSIPLASIPLSPTTLGPAHEPFGSMVTSPRDPRRSKFTIGQKPSLPSSAVQPATTGSEVASPRPKYPATPAQHPFVSPLNLGGSLGPDTVEKKTGKPKKTLKTTTDLWLKNPGSIPKNLQSRKHDIHRRTLSPLGNALNFEVDSKDGGNLTSRIDTTKRSTFDLDHKNSPAPDALSLAAKTFLSSLSFPGSKTDKPFYALVELAREEFGSQGWVKKLVETLAIFGTREQLNKVCKYLALGDTPNLAADDPKNLLFIAIQTHTKEQGIKRVAQTFLDNVFLPHTIEVQNLLLDVITHARIGFPQDWVKKAVEAFDSIDKGEDLVKVCKLHMGLVMPDSLTLDQKSDLQTLLFALQTHTTEQAIKRVAQTCLDNVFLSYKTDKQKTDLLLDVIAHARAGFPDWVKKAVEAFDSIDKREDLVQVCKLHMDLVMANSLSPEQKSDLETLLFALQTLLRTKDPMTLLTKISGLRKKSTAPDSTRHTRAPLAKSTRF